MDRVFTRNTLQVKWLCDTIYGIYKSIYRSQYAQVFSNNTYFVKVCPVYSKIKSGDALKLLCQEFVVPEKLTFGGSKGHSCKVTTFVNCVSMKSIDYHISDPDLHNQKPVEVVIIELRCKWYRTTVKKMDPWCKLVIRGDVNDSLFRK